MLIGLAAMTLAGGLWAGCTRDIPVQTLPESVDLPLNFNAPVIAPPTKSAGLPNAEMPTTYDESEHFTISALFHEDDYATASVDASSNATSAWMSLVDCGYDSTVNGWCGSAGYTASPYNSGNDYYWPPTGTGKLSFIAFSPSAIREDATVSGGFANGFTFTDFTVPDAGSQYDVLYSDRTLNRERSNYTSADPYDDTAGDAGSRNGVDIAFHHALTSIVFQAKTGADYSGTTFSIKKIEILNVQNLGTFVQGLVDDNTAASYQTGYPQWTLDTGSETDYVAFDGSLDLSTTEASTVGATGNNAMLLLPQDLYHTTSGTSVVLKLTYGQTTGGTTLLRTALIDLYNSGSYYSDQSSNVIDSWEMGKRYTYTFIITLSRIYFDPVVSTWNTATVDPSIGI